MLSKIKAYLYYIRIKLALKKRGSSLSSKHLGKDLSIGKHCIINKCCILGDGVTVGDYSYLNSSKYWITLEPLVSIGKYCSIAPGVHIGAGNHNPYYVTTHPILFNRQYLEKLPIDESQMKANGLIDTDKQTLIGNDVWIGFGAIVKRGVKIGNGAIIAAGSVVVKDVPDYAIVGGNPAKIIKYRTSEENIKLFQTKEASMWWNWDDSTMREKYETLYDFDKYSKEL